MPRVNPGPPCKICGIPSAARDLCPKHLKRWQRHGHTEQTRPDDWGVREKHPLYVRWVCLKNNVGSERAPEWDDFWRFVADVGKQPDESHELYRLNPREPFGPMNFFWRAPTVIAGLASSAREDPNGYARGWRRINWKRSGDHDRKKTYGITRADYDRMLAEQGGACAICKKPETQIHKRSGQVRELSVDHCHKSDKIRGLLCGHCNNGLGTFKDSIERLESAIAYLRRHAA